jgi:HK97 family phage prohead protease
METKHITTGAQLKTEGSEEGSLTAFFSTFGQIDRDGDVVLASAIPDGQEVPLVWAHDWSKPIGSGRIRNDGARAVFVGKFWMDTDDGVQAFRKVRNAGSMQEYSWGFSILKSNYEDFRGQRARVIKETEIFEVSPVLVGAGGRGMTGTLAVKDRRRGVALDQSARDELLFELEKSLLLGVDTGRPSRAHLLPERLQFELIKFDLRRQGINV